MAEYFIPAEMPQRAGRVVQLHEGNVSPTRPAGRDANGLPREETVCPLSRVEKFVDLAGNICDVPLSCSRTSDNSSEADKYTAIIRSDQIRAGCLPLAECPFTTEYRKLTGSPTLCEAAPGEEDCGGVPSLLAPLASMERVAAEKAAPHGCSHMKKVIAARRKLSRDSYDSQNQIGQMVPVQAAADIARAFGEGVGAKLPAPASAKLAKSNLANGHGDGG